MSLGDRAALETWGKTVGEESRKTFYRFLGNGFFDSYLSGAKILDIGYKGYLETATPILPHAVGVALDYPGYDGKTLPFSDGSQDAVFSSHVLEHIPDYRGALQEWFRVLRVGGYLVTVVPHQFLYERRAQPPSLWNADHKRFYTAATLLREIEEALPPCSFRIRFLEENDNGFDYSIEPKAHAVGSYEIICVVEKIVRPEWASRLFQGQTPHVANSFRRQPKKSDVKEPYRVIRSAKADIRSVLVLKLDHRGDFAMATDAFESIRRHYPGAHLVLACGPWNTMDALALELFDEVLPFALFPENASLKQAPFSTAQEAETAFAALLGDRHFDLALDLRWDEDSRFLLETVNAPYRAGFGTRAAFPYLNIPLALRRESIEGAAEQQMLGAPRFFSTILDHCGYAIVCPERRLLPNTFLVYGPYMSLHAGIYWVDFRIEPLEEPFQIGFDVTHNNGTYALTAGSIQVAATGSARIQLVIPSDADKIEFRLISGTKEVPPFRFLGCVLRRESSSQGLHQREAMAALVAAVRIRMMQPYKDTLEGGS